MAKKSKKKSKFEFSVYYQKDTLEAQVNLPLGSFPTILKWLLAILAIIVKIPLEWWDVIKTIP